MRSGSTTTLSIEFAAALRRRKRDRHRGQLKPRLRSTLVDAVALEGSGPVAFVADTNVYIREAAGTLPLSVQDLLDRTLLYHCTVCLGELAVGLGNADPTHRAWPRTRSYYAQLFDRIPDHRVLNPSADIWVDAGLIAAALARTQGFQSHQRKECLNDALIMLTAARAGFAVLTSNRDEFDLIQQMAPETRFVHF